MTTWMSTMLPDWAVRLIMSLAAIGLGYLGGHIVKGVLRKRIAAWAKRTSSDWDDVVTAELSRRLPLWGFFVGVYIASSYWRLTPHLANVIDKTIFAATAASVTLLAAAIAATLTREYGHKLSGDLPMTSLMQNVVRLTVVVLGVLTVLNGLGVSIAPILTALGVGGLAVALALQDTLSNLFAGIQVTLAGQIRVGNYVRLESGQEGYLMDIAWRSARIRTLPNTIILIPNSKLAQAIVTNFDLPAQEMAVLVEVGVDYGSDLRHVERVTSEVARETLQTTKGGVEAFDPFIRYHTFGDSSINFTVILRAKEFVDQYLVKHEFVKRLHERYAAEGITIPFPIRTIITRGEDPGQDGEAAA
jgi:small-conductance mechanosensitive channel